MHSNSNLGVIVVACLVVAPLPGICVCGCVCGGLMRTLGETLRHFFPLQVGATARCDQNENVAGKIYL
jgi:hypothetical protein